MTQLSDGEHVFVLDSFAEDGFKNMKKKKNTHTPQASAFKNLLMNLTQIRCENNNAKIGS